MPSPRRIAFNLIENWERKQTFPQLALKHVLRSVPDQRDRRFITAVVYGVVERKITLDFLLEQCSDRSVARLPASVLSALRMGAYQMFYMDVPPSAACNTSVDLIRQRGFAHSAGYVNAVLRRCARDREQLLTLKKADFSVRYSIDPALVTLLLEQYGKEKFVAMMESFSRPDTSVFLFHNIKRGTEQEFLGRMQQEGTALTPAGLPHMFRSAAGFAIEESAAYRDGWFHTVGFHSAEAAMFMPENTGTVFDLCAAPGGKTFIMAALTGGAVRAFDVHAHKVSALAASAERLGHANVTALQADSSVLIDDLCGTADFVLCDVPCSGLGMMGKKPDIKYKTYQSADFTELQYRILVNGGRYLRSGGRLVYSTCTLDRRENEEVVARFLKDFSDFLPDESALPGGQTTCFPEQGGDGFYIAVLKKG